MAWLRSHLAAGALCLTAPSAIHAGDADAGRALAEEHCARCHLIDAGAPPGLSPPAFAETARLPAEVIRSRILFPSFHAIMPRFSQEVIAPNVDDLVAYVQSLGKAN